jgi:hypothetical protein
MRLTRRLLDLRRPQMQNNLMPRYRVAMLSRKYLDARGFVEIETPVLYESTPDALSVDRLELKNLAIAALDRVHRPLRLPARGECLAGVTGACHCRVRCVEGAVDVVSERTTSWRSPKSDKRIAHREIGCARSAPP